MNEQDRLMFHALKWIIERDNWTPEIRKEMDKDICDKIVELINPTTNQEDCCEMDAQTTQEGGK